MHILINLNFIYKFLDNMDKSDEEYWAIEALEHMTLNEKINYILINDISDIIISNYYTIHFLIMKSNFTILI